MLICCCESALERLPPSCRDSGNRNKNDFVVGQRRSAVPHTRRFAGAVGEDRVPGVDPRRSRPVLARTYGEVAARAAIAEVHTQVWIEILRTPIPELVRVMVEMGTTEREEVLGELRNYRDKILPADQAGGGVRHFNSILVALERLSKALDATPRAA